MVTSLTPSNTSNFGLTRIQRGPAESQQQFDATKDQATYGIGADTFTLVLDGKIDDALAAGLPKGYDQRLLLDVRELGPKAEALRQACVNAQDSNNTAYVDLGTGHDWLALPNYDTKTHAITSYDVLSGPGPQSLNVRLKEGALDVVLTSKDEARRLSHSARASFGADGTCTPTAEIVTWYLAK